MTAHDISGKEALVLLLKSPNPAKMVSRWRPDLICHRGGRARDRWQKRPKPCCR